MYHSAESTLGPGDYCKYKCICHVGRAGLLLLLVCLSHAARDTVNWATHHLYIRNSTIAATAMLLQSTTHLARRLSVVQRNALQIEDIWGEGPACYLLYAREHSCVRIVHHRDWNSPIAQMGTVGFSEATAALLCKASISPPSDWSRPGFRTHAYCCSWCLAIQANRASQHSVS